MIDFLIFQKRNHYLSKKKFSQHFDYLRTLEVV